jgi:hypothetical protein
LPNGKDTAFLFRTYLNNTKNDIRIAGMQLFFKKSKKTLARKEISCTFATAFGNE